MLVERIKELSEKRGENLKSVAQKLGFSENAFYKWNAQSPKSENLEKVADYFGVSTDYLLGRTNNKLEEVDPEVRSLARDIQNLNSGDKRLLQDLIKSMRQRGKEASDE